MKQFLEEISRVLPAQNVTTKFIERLAWGTDAGFYRLIPQVVLFPESEEQVAAIVRIAWQRAVPLTFRAAGTSLSGQAITDSVLVVCGKGWERFDRLDEAAEMVAVQPGIVGARLNEILKKFGRKFSPDPASIKSAMVGGIIMNNASGMNCGTHANSDKVIRAARLVMSDGFVLDTGNENSRNSFAKRYPLFLAELMKIREDVLSDEGLKNLILRKYSIKNVTGLNILPLVEHSDPFDIITHLIVGSEGTLAFLSEATVATEKLPQMKASGMVYFENLRSACEAVVELKRNPAVISCELLDRKALRAVEDKPEMPPFLKTLPTDAASLLLETKAENEEELQENVASITQIVSKYKLCSAVEFLDKASDYEKLWAIRSGVFPSVGAMREAGTTCLIEDVAFHIEDLPDATIELQEIIARHGYADGAIYGHALEGNYHFIINQSFGDEREVERYEALMEDVIGLVADKYRGSLKAEHGTGRNMAPFIVREWGERAFAIMERVKRLFDPQNIFNRGVIFNPDPHCHIRNLKPMPIVNRHVDKCIECGFCEVNCLTCGLTLSSRQRIVTQREIRRLTETGDNERRLEELVRDYKYLGNETCAGDGLCATSCPMGINTAHLTHDLRAFKVGSFGWRVGKFSADHFSAIKSALRPVLWTANAAHLTIGSEAMSGLCNFAHNSLGLPLWTPAMPLPYKYKSHNQPCCRKKVVYFPSCINQTMGVDRMTREDAALVDRMISLLNKAGYEVIFPEGMENLCCGTIWESKGMEDIANEKSRALEQALVKASLDARYPVLCDQSPCLYRMRNTIKSLKLYEPAEFIETFLIDRLSFKPIDEPVALHITCSMRKMGLADTIIRLARRCSANVIVPEEVGCCGFAGDRGFSYPQVNKYALRKLRPRIVGIARGYSNSRTCEIGLQTNGGIPYQSIVYLVDRATQ